MKTAVNSLGRIVPLEVPGAGAFEPYSSPFGRIAAASGMRSAPKPVRAAVPCRDKRAKSLRDAIEKSGLRDGMTISFHHHLRNGDAVIPMVLAELEAMGFKNLTFAPSSIPDAHDCVADYIRAGSSANSTPRACAASSGSCFRAARPTFP